VAPRTKVASTVYDALERLWPGRFEVTALSDGAELGSNGIGLDSIEIVELLLECDERLGNGVRAEELLEAGPITIGRLVDHLTRA
jgi:acyl carrier protein